jgi:hypothetical protein
VSIGLPVGTYQRVFVPANGLGRSSLDFGAIETGTSLAMTFGMAAEQTFDVPDLDLPPPRARASEPAPKEESVYDATSIEIEDSEPMPRVTHVDQAIFDAVATPAKSAPTLAPAVSGTTRCGRCTQPIAFHARICPHCNALVMPIAPYASPPPTEFKSEPVTLWGRIADVLSTIPYGIWKRSAGYTFLVMVLGNACTCRKLSIGMNLMCALVIAISLIGVGACVNQRNP